MSNERRRLSSGISFFAGPIHYRTRTVGITDLAGIYGRNGGKWARVGCNFISDRTLSAASGPNTCAEELMNRAFNSGLRATRRLCVHRGTELSVFEDLESRLLMSASLLAGEKIVEASPLSVLTAKKSVGATAAKCAAKTATAPAAPAAVADPAVTDPSITYKSFAGDPLFATGGPKETDINQGDVGDCYFLATLASVAKVDPKLITQDITTNTDGSFTVKLDQGKAVDQVRVTASLPVFSDGQLAYAGLGTSNCLWVAVMEKAYAVMRTNADSYGSLNGGWMSDAFNALGVKNASVFFNTNATALFKTLSADVKAGDALTYGTNSNIADSAPLIGGHAYTVDAVTLSANGQPLSLTLRNPWGNGAANDGEVTLTLKQAMDNFVGLTIGML
jgi:hypothetical protein